MYVEAIPVALRANSLLCAQGSLLVELGMLGIIVRSAACKASPPTCLIISQRQQFFKITEQMSKWTKNKFFS